MDNLKMHTPDLKEENFQKLAEMFPNAVTETQNDKGEIVRAIDADVLRQEISATVVEDSQERYRFTWPDKKKSVILANQPIAKTLRLDHEKSVGRDGTMGSVDTENIYIEGDNLDALKLLQETYLGKVKMIYIDPPYNTGTDDLVYDDDSSISWEEFTERSGQKDESGGLFFDMRQNNEANGRFHTDWLNMIYPRLRISKDLMSDDGVIFISIDDHEQENLKRCCDEIFGEGNFIGCLSVENNPKGRKNSAFISVSSEYCIIYAKNKSSAYFIENIPKPASDMQTDEEGRFVHSSGKRVLVGENSFNPVVTNKDSNKNYSVYYSREKNDIKLIKEEYGESDESLIFLGYKKYYSFYGDKLVENTYSMEKFQALFEEKALDFGDEKIHEKNFSDTIRIKSQLVNKKYDAIVHGVKKKYSLELTTTGAETYLKSLFKLDKSPFDKPKNIGLLKVLISLLDGNDFTVMDFFSGSATTGDAVMRVNQADGGQRKFILVQLPEICKEGSNANNAGFKNICEIGEERIRRAGEKIKEESEFPIEKLDIGFRVFRVDDTNMKDVYYCAEDYSQDQLKLFVDNIKPDRTSEDLLYQVMLDLGILLSSKIEEIEIEGKHVFSVANDYLIACFDCNVTEDIVANIAKRHPVYAVFRDNGMATDSVMANFDQIFETYSPKTQRKVL